MNIYSQILKENDLCFDIGANSGNKTQEMLTYGAKVICLEPQTRPFQHLNNRFNNNEKVVLINKAVSNFIGESEIFISNSTTISTMSSEFIEKTSELRFKGAVWNQKEVVKTTTLDELIKTYGTPKFCKIDVEGYELEVLKGLNNIIPFISIEFVPELKHNTFSCIEKINSISDCEFNYSEGESMVFTFDNWLSKKEIIDFLSKNKDFKFSFGDVYIKMV